MKLFRPSVVNSDEAFHSHFASQVPNEIIGV